MSKSYFLVLEKIQDAVVVRMFGLLPRTLYKYYKEHLNAYHTDKTNGKWSPQFIEKVDLNTGEIVQDKLVISSSLKT